MLEWDKIDQRYYHDGLDHGVLYLAGKDPVPWNGLTGCTEGGEGGAASVLYRDGQIYLSKVAPSDFTERLTALWFPDEFGEALGMPQVTDGLIVDNQPPKQFDLSYRTIIGKGGKGDPFGHQIHLVYRAMASISSRQRKTLSGSPAPVEMEFSLVCTPVRLPGYRPTAHFIIDTRFLSKSQVTQLEGILYGSGDIPGRMPMPIELFDLLNFGSAITFTTWTHPTLGECWTAEGAASNVFMETETTFRIKNVNGTDHGDGTYTLVDTP